MASWVRDAASVHWELVIAGEDGAGAMRVPAATPVMAPPPGDGFLASLGLVPVKGTRWEPGEAGSVWRPVFVTSFARHRALRRAVTGTGGDQCPVRG